MAATKKTTQYRIASTASGAGCDRAQWLGPARPGKARPGPERLGPERPGPDRPRLARPGLAQGMLRTAAGPPSL